MADGLTQAAKDEIAAAINIVREDRFEKFARERLVKHAPAVPPPDPLFDPPKDPPKDPIVPPPPKDPTDPPKDPPADPPADPPKGRKSAYWGEILE